MSCSTLLIANFIFSKENNSSSAIEKIVENFFIKTKKITNKNREFGTSVTDLDELRNKNSSQMSHQSPRHAIISTDLSSRSDIFPDNNFLSSTQTTL